MHAKSFVLLLATSILLVPPFTFSQDAGEKRTLILNGQTTQVPVIQVNGQSYIGLDALAAAVNGSISYSGNSIALSVPIGSASTASAVHAPTVPAPSPAAPPNPGFSQAFLTAGIEQMASLREWHAALRSALENGIPVTAALLLPYRAQSTTNLRLVSVAASTPSDRNALELLNNEYQNMVKLSDQYIKLRDSLTYVSPDALRSDDLNQRIVACGHALGAMAASGQFTDDASCH